MKKKNILGFEFRCLIIRNCVSFNFFIKIVYASFFYVIYISKNRSAKFVCTKTYKNEYDIVQILNKKGP